MTEKDCEYCGDLIPSHRKKNSKYCCDECYYEHKKSDAALKSKKKIEQQKLLHNDEVVHDLYMIYQSNYYISAAEFIKRNFFWNIHSGETTISGYNLKAKKLIRYGYTLFTNQTLQLWKF